MPPKPSNSDWKTAGGLQDGTALNLFNHRFQKRLKKTSKQREGEPIPRYLCSMEQVLRCLTFQFYSLSISLSVEGTEEKTLSPRTKRKGWRITKSILVRLQSGKVASLRNSF